MYFKLGSDKSLVNIFVINGLIVFIYAILFSSLTTYLTKSLDFKVIEAENVAGLFLALNFILHLLSGYMGERFISNRQILFLSGIIQLIGTVYLSRTSKHDIFLGLSMVVIGCGLNTTSLQCILTSKFEKSDIGRERAFFWMYSALNVGFLMGFSVAGYYEFSRWFNNLYIFAAGVGFFSVLWIGLSWSSLSEGHENTNTKRLGRGANLIGYSIFFALIPICEAAFRYPEISNDIILTTGLLALMSTFYLAISSRKSQAKDGLLAFFILTFFSIVFWALFYIGPLGGVIFLENNVQLTIFGYTVAPQWLMNLNSVFIILGAPLMGKFIEHLKGRGLKITIPRQFLASLILIAFSYFVYSTGVYFCNDIGKTSIIWVVLHYAFQASGELLIAPVGYAMIGKLIPRRQQGYMMGIWMMVSGIAVELSNVFSHYMNAASGSGQIATNHQYISVFNKLGISTCLLAVVLFMALGFLERLVKSASNEKSSYEFSEKKKEAKVIYAR